MSTKPEPPKSGTATARGEWGAPGLQTGDSAFILRFESRPSEITATTFIATLVGITGLLDEANMLLGGDEQLRINVRAPEPGSLLVELIVIPADIWKHATDLLTGENLTYAAGLILLVNRLLKLRQHLGKAKGKVVGERGGEVVVENSTGTTMHIDKRVFNFYNTSVSVNQKIDKTFASLSGDPDIEAFEVLDLSGTPTFSAKRDEFGSLIAGTQPDTKDREARPIRTRLYIVKPSFDKKLRWTFIFDGNRIGAVISDEAFLARVEARIERFAKGDYLDVDLEIDREYSEEVGTYVNKGYRVLVVHGHVASPQQATIKGEG